NVEQLRAMRIIAHYLCAGPREQPLMYIGGSAGMGKSHVICSMESLFDKLFIQDKLHLSAPTGAAAVLIGGYTIHSLTQLLAMCSLRVNQDSLEQVWQHAQWLVINEISMVSSKLLYEIS
ncbi:hypothetical protein DACRYDRAFT_43057, partial [Dacryopinax primogenitus]